MKTTTRIEARVAWRKICPSIQNVKIENLDPRYKHFEEWGWVLQEELAECVQNVLALDGIVWPEDGVIRHDSIFENYGLLEHDGEGKPLFTWANMFGVVRHGSPPFASEWQAPFLVSARWSNGVRSLARQGIVKVSLLPMPISPPMHYWRIGHNRAGELFELISPSDLSGNYMATPHLPRVEVGLQK